LKLPDNIANLGNYINAIEKGQMLIGFKNTLLLSIVCVSGSVLMGTMVAYALGRFDFKFKKVILNAFLASTIIPSITTQVATFTVIKNLGIYNTIYAGMILYLATDIIQIYIFLQFIKKIPCDLDESATVDGASYFKIYWSIILPQMIPAIATAVILKTLTIYNDMFIPYLYMPKSSLRTITISIMRFSNDQNSQWNIMAAGIITVMIPTLLLYLFLQRYIISGVTDGAVKG
jgi:multiple sugar transport system permease protein